MGKFGGFQGGMPNMANLMKQAQKMQQDLQKKQEEAANMEFKAVSGGGAVTVVATGDRVIKEIIIKEDVIDKDDIDMLQDLILVAVNDCLTQIANYLEDGLGSLNGLM